MSNLRGGGAKIHACITYEGNLHKDRKKHNVSTFHRKNNKESHSHPLDNH